MGKHGSFVDDGSMFGRVEFPGDFSDSRRDRFVDHGWMEDDGSLNEDGKAILKRWNEDPDPQKSLTSTSAPSWVGEGRRDWGDLTGDIGSREYKGLPVRSEGGDDVPSGYRHYIEREVADGQSDLELMAHMLSRGNHLLLKGHAGTGKTGAAQHLAQRTNTETSQVNFSEEVRMQHLFGHYEVREVNGGTEMEWVNGVLLDRIENGGWFVADEANMADGAITSILHSLLEKQSGDGTARMTVPEKGESVEVSDDFRLIATENPRYEGTKQKNKAFADRLFEIPFGYLSEDDDIEIVEEAIDDAVPRDQIERVVSVGRQLRRDFLNGELSIPITPRAMIRAGELLEGGFMSPEAAAKQAYMNNFEKDERTPVEKTIETCI